MNRLIMGLFVLVALIHLVPTVGVLSADRLHGLYGVTIEDPDLLILMRHRAVLLGIVGVLVGVAAFRPSLRPAASFAAFANMLAFIAIAMGAEGIGPEVERVAFADGVACVLLVAAWCLPGARSGLAGSRDAD